MNTKKQHPSEVAAEADMIEAIRGADHFLASIFLGRGYYDKCAAPNVARAIREAHKLEDAHPNYRQAMIYAVAKDGRATLLTRSLVRRLFADRLRELSNRWETT